MHWSRRTSYYQIQGKDGLYYLAKKPKDDDELIVLSLSFLLKLSVESTELSLHEIEEARDNCLLFIFVTLCLSDISEVNCCAAAKFSFETAAIFALSGKEIKDNGRWFKYGELDIAFSI